MAIYVMGPNCLTQAIVRQGIQGGAGMAIYVMGPNCLTQAIVRQGIQGGAGMAIYVMGPNCLTQAIVRQGIPGGAGMAIRHGSKLPYSGHSSAGYPGWGRNGHTSWVQTALLRP